MFVKLKGMFIMFHQLIQAALQDLITGTTEHIEAEIKQRGHANTTCELYAAGPDDLPYNYVVLYDRTSRHHFQCARIRLTDANMYSDRMSYTFGAPSMTLTGALKNAETLELVGQ